MRRRDSRLQVIDAADVLAAMVDELVVAELAHVVPRSRLPVEELDVKIQARLIVRGCELVPGKIAFGRRCATGGLRRAGRGKDCKHGALRIREDRKCPDFWNPGRLLANLCAETAR